MARGSKASEKQEIRWQAESVVRQAIEKTPSYKKAVTETVRQLKKAQKVATDIIKNKK